MQERKLIQGVNIPSIGLGTYGMRDKECENAIESALDIGYRHIDTAQMYDNEVSIGIALKRSKIPREDIFITTKVWPSDFSKEKFFRSVEQSLRKLQLEQVDLLLLHWPSDNTANIEATGYLSECLKLSYARQIGVSNFNIPQLEQARKQAPIFCNQLLYHPMAQKPQMLGYLQANDILLTAYSPLALGKLSHNNTLKDIGIKYHKSPAQIVLRWLIQQSGVVAIPKAVTIQHQKENLEVFDFTLGVGDIKRIGQLPH